IVRLEPQHLIGSLCCRRQLRLVSTQLHGVGARLNYRHDSFGPHTFAQTIQRGRYRRGVVGKIIIDVNAVEHTQILHAPLDSRKTAQGFTGCGGPDPHMPGSGNRSQRIVDIVDTGLPPVNTPSFFTLEKHTEVAAILTTELHLPVTLFYSELNCGRPAAATD